ncbi:hypothetical protein AB0D91_46460 [Streptomyces canus]|uniref:hypothetical protein n=1 Tax=Streptomyces canus TaxID=58343 RepID=UPI00340DEFB9
MSAPLLLVTEIPVDEDPAEALAAWQDRPTAPGSVLYRGLEAPTLLELTPLEGLAELAGLGEQWRQQAKALAPLVVGDVRRQVLQFVEAPKPAPAGAALPDTPYVQLRHVEVKPPVHEEYLTWRDGTIFDVVRTTEQVDTFLAYHSLLSTEPGVMFVAGFSCAPEDYLPAFSSQRYGEIARHAHSRFVTEDGLYTRLYQRVAEAV